jgi:osmoprotectant transport system permease protein
MIKYKLISLEDDKHLFPPYQGAPLLRKDTLEKYPELEKILNKLAGKISDEEMREMNYRVDYQNEDAAHVAREFLEKNGLINHK